MIPLNNNRPTGLQSETLVRSTVSEKEGVPKQYEDMINKLVDNENVRLGDFAWKIKEDREFTPEQRFKTIKLLVEKYPSTSEVINYFHDFKVFGLEQPAHLFEVAKLCAQKDGKNTASCFSHFFNRGLKDSDHAFEVAKLCAQGGYDIVSSIGNFRLSDPQRFEIVKFCAQNNPKDTARNFGSIGLTDYSQKFEIAKLCAERKAKATILSFNNFGITNTKDVLEIFNLCAQNNAEKTAQYLHILDKCDRSTHSSNVLKLFMLCAQKNATETVNYINLLDNVANFYPSEVFNIAQICAQNAAKAAVKNFEKFYKLGLTNEQLCNIAQICAQNNAKATVENFDNFDERGLTNEQLFNIAQICAQNDGEATAKKFDNFDYLGLTSEQVFKIAQLCAKQAGGEILPFIHNFHLKDIHHLFHVIQIAIATALPSSRTLVDFFEDFDPEDFPSLTPHHQIDILLSCHYAADLPDDDPYKEEILSNSHQEAWSLCLREIPQHDLPPGCHTLCTQLFSTEVDATDRLSFRSVTSTEWKSLLEKGYPDLPCCRGSTPNAASNQALFQNLIKTISDVKGENDKETSDLQIRSYKWLANVMARLSLEQVSDQALATLAPIITALMAYRNPSQRIAFNRIICSNQGQLPTDWLERFPKTGKDVPNHMFVMALLEQLDSQHTLPSLHQKVGSATARDTFRNESALQRYGNACAALLRTPELSTDQRTALLTWIDQHVDAMTEKEIDNHIQAFIAEMAPRLSKELEEVTALLKEAALPPQQRTAFITQRKTVTANIKAGIESQAIVAAVKEGTLFQVLQETFHPFGLSPLVAEKVKQLEAMLAQRWGNVGAMTAQERETHEQTWIAEMPRVLNQVAQSIMTALKDAALLPTQRAALEAQRQAVETNLKVLVKLAAVKDGTLSDVLRTAFQPFGLSSEVTKSIKSLHTTLTQQWARVNGLADELRIKQLIHSLHHVKTVMELDSAQAALRLITEPNLTLQDLLRSTFQKILGMTQDFDAEKFLAITETWRDPNAMMTYAGRVKSIATAMAGLRVFVPALTNNTFADIRYQNDVWFDKLSPEVKTKWRDNTLFNQPLDAMLNKVKHIPIGIARAGSLRDAWFAAVQVKFMDDEHLGKTKYFPILKRYFEEGGVAEHALDQDEGMIENMSPESPDEVADFKNKIAFQTALIAFIEKPNLAKFKVMQDAYAALGMKKQFDSDLKDWEKTWTQSPQNYAGWTLQLTDDPQTLVMMGTEVSSCQNIAGDPDYNQGLIGTVLDPKVKILAATNPEGKIIGRHLLRMVWKPDGTAALLLERQYPDLLQADLSRALVEHAISCAQGLGLELMTVNVDSSEMQPYHLQEEPTTLIFGEMRYPAYIDSLKGITTGSEQEEKMMVGFLHKMPTLVDRPDKLFG